MTLTRRWLGFVLAGMVLTLTGCGTWMHGDHQSVTLFTTPADAKVVVDDVVAQHRDIAAYGGADRIRGNGKRDAVAR